MQDGTDMTEIDVAILCLIYITLQYISWDAFMKGQV